MIVLGIETATIACGVALVSDAGVLGTMQIATRQAHSERLMPLVDALLRETGISRSELAGIAVSQGPGSFTGLRIGIATAKAIALGLGLPVAGVPTLAAVAANAGEAASLVWPALVAKKDEVYGAVYRGGEEPTLLGEPWACPPEELLPRALAATADALGAADAAAAWLVGDAYARFADALGLLATGSQAGPTQVSGRRVHILGAHAALPQAAVVARLGRAALLRGEGVDAAALEPLYVRRPQAELVLAAREAEEGGARRGRCE
ncbi:MAG: tRNA (adenosine(37)-N6)-threonylcarbamoyltransferase complex dimerization subunit type 1 TsaB [Chloroflexota bacterium]